MKTTLKTGTSATFGPCLEMEPHLISGTTAASKTTHSRVLFVQACITYGLHKIFVRIPAEVHPNVPTIITLTEYRLALYLPIKHAWRDISHKYIAPTRTDRYSGCCIGFGGKFGRISCVTNENMPGTGGKNAEVGKTNLRRLCGGHFECVRSVGTRVAR